MIALKTWRPIALLLSATLGVAAVTVAARETKTPFSEASSLQQQLNESITKSAPSVVAVTALSDVPHDADLFNGKLQGPSFAKWVESRKRSVGSGFAISEEGHFLTSEHVVADASSVWITTDDGKTYPAVVVGTDPRGDLAILRASVALPVLQLRNADQLSRGDLTVALGNPSGIGVGGQVSASVGNVSGLGRALPALSRRENKLFANLIQTTTPVSQGSSGGPLIDLAGYAVGIVCAVVPPDDEGGAIGFAIPLSSATLAKVDRIRVGGEVSYSYLGVVVSPAVVDRSRLAGVRIDRVDIGAPADGILYPGDVVTAINGNSILDDNEFTRIVAGTASEQELPLTIRRKDLLIDVVVRPAKRPTSTAPVTHDTQRLEWSGVQFMNHPDGGVRVSRMSDANFAPELRQGQHIRSVDGRSVGTVADLLPLLFDRVHDAPMQWK
jgi:S1-C subfamily serine protease